MPELLLDTQDQHADAEAAQLARIGCAMKDTRIAWQMFEFIGCLARQGHPKARAIMAAVMTYQPPAPVLVIDSDF